MMSNLCKYFVQLLQIKLSYFENLITTQEKSKNVNLHILGHFFAAEIFGGPFEASLKFLKILKLKKYRNTWKSPLPTPPNFSMSCCIWDLKYDQAKA